MCKTNVKMVIYYANICKHEHEKIITRLKINVKQTKRNERVLTLFIHLWGPSSKKLPKKLLCVHQVISFSKTFLTENRQ
jgi:hypothetical protein